MESENLTQHERPALLGLFHQVPPDLRHVLKEAGFGWAGWNASWRHPDTGAAITFAEVRDHLDETWVRQRIAEVLGAAQGRGSI